MARLDTHGGPVHCVAWAPSVGRSLRALVLSVAFDLSLAEGRSYHLIATASKDHCVRIFKVTPPDAPVDDVVTLPKNIVLLLCFSSLTVALVR